MTASLYDVYDYEEATDMTEKDWEKLVLWIAQRRCIERPFDFCSCTYCGAAVLPERYDQHIKWHHEQQERYRHLLIPQ